jgi:cytochrome P450
MLETAVRLLDEQTLGAPGFFVDPYPFFHRLRREDPIHWSQRWNCWVLTRYADVLSSMHDPRLSNAMRARLYMNQLPEDDRIRMQQLTRHISTWMAFHDPPDHTRLRALVNKAFTWRVVDGMRPRIQKIVDELLAPLEHADRADMIREFAYPLPAIVIAEFLGVPREDRDHFKRWSDEVVAFLGTGRAVSTNAQRAQQSLLELGDYFERLIEMRRSHQEEDFLSALVAAEEEGKRLREEEMIAMCTSLLIAGHETTTNMLGNGILALLRNGGELQRLSDNPSLIELAVEEFLRFDTPVQRNWRAASEDFEWKGKRIKKGDLVLQMLGAANRDPAQFPDPDRLDLTRQPNPHVAFGHGIHFCLGAPLARTEGRIAFCSLLRLLPTMYVQSGQVEWLDNMAFRGLKSLPVTLGRS